MQNLLQIRDCSRPTTESAASLPRASDHRHKELLPTGNPLIGWSLAAIWDYRCKENKKSPLERGIADPLNYSEGNDQLKVGIEATEKRPVPVDANAVSKIMVPAAVSKTPPWRVAAPPPVKTMVVMVEPKPKLTRLLFATCQELDIVPEPNVLVAES